MIDDARRRLLPLHIAALAVGCSCTPAVDYGPAPPESPTPAREVDMPDDPMPATNATPGASADATPAWYPVEHPHMSASEKRRPPSPSWDSARIWFRTAAKRKHTGSIHGQYFICKVQVRYRERRPNLPRSSRHSKADLDLWGRLPTEGKQGHLDRQSETSMAGPGESSTSYIVFPLAYLEPGESFELKVWDRDVVTRDAIATLRPTYAGALPLRETSSRADLDCGVLSDGDRHGHAMGAAHRVDQLLWQLQHDPESAPKTPEVAKRVSLAFGELASWTGWSDPRVQPRLAELQSVWPGFPAPPAAPAP